MKHRISFPSMSLKKLIRGRLPLLVGCSTVCRARVEVRVAAKLNRRLRLGGRKIGTKSRIGVLSQRVRAGNSTVRVRLTAKAVLGLKKVKARHLPAQLVIAIEDSTGWKAAAVTHRLKLR